MIDNYGHLLEKGIAPELAFIAVQHPTRNRKYRCGCCKGFVWPFQMADFRKVPSSLKGGDTTIDFACDGCVSAWERNHSAIMPTQPAKPGPNPWRGLAPTQGSGWRTKQGEYRDQVKAAQEVEA